MENGKWKIDFFKKNKGFVFYFYFYFFKIHFIFSFL
jgi:hypothetical protein